MLMEAQHCQAQTKDRKRHQTVMNGGLMKSDVRGLSYRLKISTTMVPRDSGYPSMSTISNFQSQLFFRVLEELISKVGKCCWNQVITWKKAVVVHDERSAYKKQSSEQHLISICILQPVAVRNRATHKTVHRIRYISCLYKPRKFECIFCAHQITRN